MKIQVVQDSDGNNTGVFIPYDDWSELKKQHKALASLEEKKNTSNGIVKNIKKGLKEVQQYKKGLLKTTPAKEFLNEL